jgi:uncharacterized membrane protein AbrB (regulator of aidB expression)
MTTAPASPRRAPLAAHILAWVQAMAVALLFGIALLLLGIPVALVMGLIAGALAWIASAL